MNRWTQIAVAAGVVVVAVVLFVVLRPDDDEETDATPAAQTTTAESTTEETTTDEGTTEDTTTEEAPTTTESGPPPPQRLVVRVEGGAPVGGVQRFDVEKGRQVVLVVRSDVSDHMHLHGYDLLEDVAPGQPARITFRANMTGRFDLELEDRVVLIAELRVR